MKAVVQLNAQTPATSTSRSSSASRSRMAASCDFGLKCCDMLIHRTVVQKRAGLPQTPGLDLVGRSDPLAGPPRRDDSDKCVLVLAARPARPCRRRPFGFRLLTPSLLDSHEDTRSVFGWGSLWCSSNQRSIESKSVADESSNRPASVVRVCPHVRISLVAPGRPPPGLLLVLLKPSRAMAVTATTLQERYACPAWACGWQAPPRNPPWPHPSNPPSPP